MKTTPQIAIIGAGVAGLSCAHHLQQVGVECVVYDKSRGPGGRISSKRTTDAPVDLGAQYFTARNPSFSAWLADAHRAGAVAQWQPRLAVLTGGELTGSPDQQVRWVGHPKMGQLAHFMAHGVNLKAATPINSIAKSGPGFRVSTDQSVETFSQVVVATPADQAQTLTGQALPEQAPCWAVWLEVDTDLPYDAVFIKDPSMLGWMALDSSKPGRTSTRRWVLHPTSQWSQTHIEAEADWVVERATAAFKQVFECQTKVVASGAHRWRYARPWESQEPFESECIAADSGMIFAGDYVNGGRVEGAWLSGRAAAQLVLNRI